MITVWEWIKRIALVLFLAILLMFGGRMIWNYYKYGTVKGQKYETEEHKWKESEKLLSSGLGKLQKQGIDLWEANEIWQELDKIQNPPNADLKNVPPKIIQITADILKRLGEIFKDFTTQVIEGQIKLSELEEEKFLTVIAVKNQAKQIFEKNKKNLNVQERQQQETIFQLLESKINEEQLRRNKS